MTKYEVVLTDYATKDLLDIYCYGAFEDSFENADKLTQSLKNACWKLSQLPNCGHTPPEFEYVNISSYLEIHSKEYRIICEVGEKTVYVYCILHMKRDIFDLLKERLLS